MILHHRPPVRPGPAPAPAPAPPRSCASGAAASSPGVFLTALTLFGLELHRAFSALAHPGYKHSVRLRVRKDGSAVDGWVLGRVDPLGARDSVVLVDRFTWKNQPAAAATEPETP